jgi:F0F1-type ATP synthase delta subunit
MALSQSYAESVFRTLLSQGTEEEIREALSEFKRKLQEAEDARKTLPVPSLSDEDKATLFAYINNTTATGNMKGALDAANVAVSEEDLGRLFVAIVQIFIEMRSRVAPLQTSPAPSARTPENLEEQ